MGGPLLRPGGGAGARRGRRAPPLQAPQVPAPRSARAPGAQSNPPHMRVLLHAGLVPGGAGARPGAPPQVGPHQVGPPHPPPHTHTVTVRALHSPPCRGWRGFSMSPYRLPAAAPMMGPVQTARRSCCCRRGATATALDQRGNIYNQNAATGAASHIDGLEDDNDEPVSEKTKVEHFQQPLVKLDGASFDYTPESDNDPVTSDADSLTEWCR